MTAVQWRSGKSRCLHGSFSPDAARSAAFFGATQVPSGERGGGKTPQGELGTGNWWLGIVPVERNGQLMGNRETH